MSKLSILIPARNEIFLQRTVDDILANIEGDTDIIVGLDGCWAEPPIVDHPKVTIIHYSTSIGQRAITNECAKLSKAKYLMKVDAHCAFDKGFDVKMMNLMEDDMTMVPVMRNLHAFDWVCSDGHRRYQSPSGNCTECGKPTTQEIVWIAKKNPQSVAYRFDTDMHFQYWNDWGKQQKGDLTESLSIQGSCFMVTRDKYFELDLCSEEFHNWGQQGVEVACKTWLSGGRVMINRTTWYAHMFRTQGGDFSFPYDNPNSLVVENRKKSKDLFTGNNWNKAKHSFQWLLDKFNPPGWVENNNLTKGVLYYTDNRLDEKIMKACQDQLRKAFVGKTVSVSLKPIDFRQNIVLPLERGYLTQTQQIIAGLEALDTDIVFMCEHDVLYHPSHFDFTPTKKDVYYYNTNSWMVRVEDGHCLYYHHRSLSGMCAYRETLLTHYRERLRRIEELEASAVNGIVKAISGNDIPLKEGIHRLGFEPGTHGRPERIDKLGAENYFSIVSNIDLKHKHNLTKNRWRLDQFRDKSVSKTWKEIENYQIEGWENLKELLYGKYRVD